MMLAAYSKYLPPNKYLNNILTQKVIEEAYKIHDYESVINRFALYAFLGVTEGDYKLSILQLIDENPQQQQKNDCGRKKRFRGEGIAYLDLGGGQIPIGVRLEKHT